MTDEQKVAYVQAQATAALIEAMGMAAKNTQQAHWNESIPYGEEAFQDVITRYGLHHNNLLTLFHNYGG